MLQMKKAGMDRESADVLAGFVNEMRFYSELDAKGIEKLNGHSEKLIEIFEGFLADHKTLPCSIKDLGKNFKGFVSGEVAQPVLVQCVSDAIEFLARYYDPRYRYQ